MFTVLDLFAGAGGLSDGFAHNDAFRIVAANEIAPAAARAYRPNHPGTFVYVRPIEHLTAAEVCGDLRIDKIDVIIGGPPCQAYSLLGTRSLDDPRAHLYLEYVRMVREFRPRIILYENVVGLLSMGRGRLVTTIMHLFREIGYLVSFRVLNAADYGVPQLRRRVIIVGTRSRRLFKFPAPTQPKPYMTIAGAISDLSLDHDNRYACDPQNKYQEMMRANRLRDHLPRAIAKSRLSLIGTRAYRRLYWHEPCPTVTGHFNGVHPLAPRLLTTRECARIQSFPDRYRFCGSTSDRNLQIGNAVPPLLSVALADAVAKHLEG